MYCIGEMKEFRRQFSPVEALQRQYCDTVHEFVILQKIELSSREIDCNN